MSPIVYWRGRWYGNWDHKAGGSRLEKLEEIQRSTVRQKDASETEWECIQNSDQASNAIWDRNVGDNEETRTTDWGDRDEDAAMDVRSDTQRQDQEWTHPRNNKSGAGFQKDHREKIELVRAYDEERWRTHTEESVEGGYTREKEERTTENKIERRVSTRFEKYWTESGRGDRQGDVEKKDHQLYRRTYMMRKARGKEEEEDMSPIVQATITATRRLLSSTGLLDVLYRPGCQMSCIDQAARCLVSPRLLYVFYHPGY